MAQESDEKQNCIRFYSWFMPPFSDTRKGQDGTYEIYGVVVDLIHMLMHHFDLCYSIEKLIPGNCLPNNSCTRILQHFEQGTADYGVGTLALSSENAHRMDYTLFYISANTIAFKTPTIEPDLFGFIKPYSYAVWIGIVVSLLLVIFIMKAVNRTLYNYKAGLQVFTAMTPLRILLSQDLPKLPSASARVLIGVWMLTTLIISTVYKSNLKAMLITPKAPLPYDSLEGMVESGLPYFIETGSYLEGVINSSPPGSLMTRVGQRSTSIIIRDEAEVLDYITRKNYGVTILSVIAMNSIHKIFSATGQCPLKTIHEHEEFVPVNLVIPMRKGFHLNPQMKKGITALRESGIVDKLMKAATIGYQTCHFNKITGNFKRALTLTDFLGVFTLYACGMLLAVCLFVAELLLHKCKQSQLQPALQQIEQMSASGD